MLSMSSVFFSGCVEMGIRFGCHRAIPHVTNTRCVVIWPEWGEQEAPMFGIMASMFGEGKAHLCTVPIPEGNAYLIGRRLTRHKFLVEKSLRNINHNEQTLLKYESQKICQGKDKINKSAQRFMWEP